MSYDNRYYSSDSLQSVEFNVRRYYLYQHQFIELRIKTYSNPIYILLTTNQLFSMEKYDSADRVKAP